MPEIKSSAADIGKQLLLSEVNHYNTHLVLQKQERFDFFNY
jgi:hypothetical protein